MHVTFLTFSNLTETAVSGKLEADGLLIELFYDRILVDYTVRYLEAGTSRVLAEEKKVWNRTFGEQISETYIDIPGYGLLSPRTQSITLTADSERNVISLYYQEKTVAIQYRPIGGGTVSLGSENVNAVSGTVKGSVPMSNPGYVFAGWFADEACTVPVNSSWVGADCRLMPQKEKGLYVGAVYYAKFVEAKATLSIHKSYPAGADYSMDGNLSFLFRVKGVATDENTKEIDLTVTVLGDGSIQIADLPAGQYTVTELTDWSWRYTPEGGACQTVTVSAGEENRVIFVNERVHSQWLDGNSSKTNEFTGIGK